MEHDEEYPQVAMQETESQTKERWYSRAGRWTGGALKKTGGFLRSAVKPTLFAIALGASSYGGFQAGKVYQSWEDGSLLEHTLMEETETRRVVRDGNKLYIHQEQSKTQALDIDMINEMMRNGQSGPIDYQ